MFAQKKKGFPLSPLSPAPKKIKRRCFCCAALATRWVFLRNRGESLAVSLSRQSASFFRKRSFFRKISGGTAATFRHHDKGESRLVLAHALLIFGKASLRFFEVVDSVNCLDSIVCFDRI